MSDELISLAERVAAKLAILTEERRRISLDSFRALERIDPELAEFAKRAFDDSEAAAVWLASQIESLGYRTPWKCLADGNREAVHRVLAAIEYGLPA